ncbi:hypothetical protein D3C72_2441000 [compost metagenome]
MLFDQLTHRGPDALIVAGALGLEQEAERRFMTIGVIQQRTRLAAVAAIEQADLGRDGSRFGHAGKPLQMGIHCL